MDLTSLEGVQVTPLQVNDEQPAVSNAPAEVEVMSSTEVPTHTVVPTNIFTPQVTKDAAPVGIDKATERADEIVGEVFGQAVLHTVANDEEVQKGLLDTAKQVVKEKASAIADKAETESKAQHFLKHEDACNCFGYDEKTTSRFHVKVMSVWVFVLNTIYIFTIGGLIVAPISFILHKLKVVIKKVWLAILLAVLIYLFIVVGIPAIGILVAKLTGSSETATEAVTLLSYVL